MGNAVELESAELLLLLLLLSAACTTHVCLSGS
jgi:hypothetical protein